jgi:2-polyprenyl-3-methyl-5-hydroxy-6-metoxy-1,4-benzoquinol methylase
MFESNNKPEMWDAMWARRDLFIKFIDVGRDFYNIFFRRLLLKNISPATELIEFGCGGSTLSLSIARRIKKLTGIDHSAESIKLSRANAEKIGVNAEFVQCDIFKLPGGLKNKFDLVWSQGLMEHFDDYAAVVRAHWEAVRPGGKILISVPFKYSYINLWYILTRRGFLKRFWPWVDQRFLTHRELRDLGKRFSKDYKVYLLPPWLVGLIFGIIILEIKKHGA